MIKISDQRWARLAAMGVLMAALGLAACGRKGPLDPPPSAAIPTQDGAPAGSAQLRSSRYPQPGVGSDGKAVAPPPTGRQDSFFLDWLVD